MDNLVSGEILEDIECLDPEESYENEDDKLNFDTFGDYTSTSNLKSSNSQTDFFENLRFGGFETHNLPNLNKIHLNDNYSRFLNFINNVETTNNNRFNRKFKELEVNPLPTKIEIVPKVIEPKKVNSPKHYEHKVQHSRAHNAHKHNNPPTHNRTRSSFKEDIKLMRKMALFPINCCKQSGPEIKFKVPRPWFTKDEVILRHRNARSPTAEEKQLYMTTVEFDNILRIQLSQVSKNPKLQNYSGRWNYKHMMSQIQNRENEANAELVDNHIEELENSNSSTAEELKKIKLFGRTSVACIRHGRKQIYLESNENFTNDGTPPIKRAKWAIEDCYEQFFIILEVIKTIKSGVGSVDKLKEDRDQKLVVLYETLTQAQIDHTDPVRVDRIFEEILKLEKGKRMIFRISKLFKSKFKTRLILEIFKTNILKPILTRDNNKITNLTLSDLDMIQFICTSINQVTSRRFPEFLIPFLNLKITKKLIPMIKSSYGTQFIGAVVNKMIDSLHEGHLDITNCKKFGNLISKAKCLSDINKILNSYIE